MFRSLRRNSASPSPAAASNRQHRRQSQGSPSVSPPPPSASSLLAEPNESAFTRSASYRERRGSRPAQEGRMQRAASVVAATSGLCSIENMSLSQATAIRKSWKHINTKGLAQVVSRSFHKVESRCPAVAAAFSNTTFLSTSPATTRSVAEHTKFLLTLLDDLIEGSGSTAEAHVMQQLRDYGAKHAPLRETCDMRAEAWEVFGEVFVEAFVKLDGVKQNKEASRGWRLLIATVTDRLRCGFEQEVRLQKRRSSLNDSAQAEMSAAAASRSRPRSRSGEEGYLRRGGP